MSAELPARNLETKVAVRTPSMVTVTENTYHFTYGVTPDELPFGTDVAFSRTLESDEQPYQRLTLVDCNWKPIDKGWIEACSFVVIKNVEVSSWELQNSEERKAQVGAKYLEVGILPPEDIGVRTMRSADKQKEPILISTVRPGESIRLSDVGLENLFVRCLGHSCRISIIIYPR